MLNLYKVTSSKNPHTTELTKFEQIAIKYHDLFDYPLSFSELIKWSAGKAVNTKSNTNIISKNGYFYIEGREGLVYKRLLRKRISAKKILIATKAATILSFLPSVKMVGITGSLAMENSSEDSDIDLMIITKSGYLWLTRLISLVCLMGQIRRSGNKNQKDKLCLNMWLDESDLIWKNKDRNIYTAHEIAQIVPLVNKDKTYEKFIYQNKWVLNYWPNSLKIKNLKLNENLKLKIKNSNILEKIAYKIQFSYMRKKITREVVTPTRALFHPQDWGKVVIARLSK